jgi:hypothetical protein
MNEKNDSLVEIGRLLRAGNAGFVAGCRVSEMDKPAFGALVRAPQADGYQIYGLIYDMRIEDDGLVRQLVTADVRDESVIADNRLNRNVPLEMSVLSVGYLLESKIHHLLPPRPPLSLDVIYLCDGEELRAFTSAGHFGYLRHILRADDLPTAELLAAHFKNALEAHEAVGDTDWPAKATREMIATLRDDYPRMMDVLSALSDISPG